jgi:hypothetical protein
MKSHNLTSRPYHDDNNEENGLTTVSGLAYDEPENVSQFVSSSNLSFINKLDLESKVLARKDTFGQLGKPVGSCHGHDREVRSGLQRKPKSSLAIPRARVPYHHPHNAPPPIRRPAHPRRGLDIAVPDPTPPR